MDPLDGTTLVSQVRSSAVQLDVAFLSFLSCSRFFYGFHAASSVPMQVWGSCECAGPATGPVSVIALAERGALFDPGPCMYMEKLAGERGVLACAVEYHDIIII